MLSLFAYRSVSSTLSGSMISSTRSEMIGVVFLLSFSIELEAGDVSFTTFVSIKPVVAGSMSLTCTDIKRHNSKAAASMQCLADPGSLAVSSRVTEQNDVMNQVCSCQTHPEEGMLPEETAAKLLLPVFAALGKGKKLWKRISVMVCEKLAYPNCSGRVITAPEDL